MSRQTTRFRSFPKTKDKRLDKERLRRLYLNDTEFEWTDFCKKHKFNPDLRGNFPILAWKREWIERRKQEQDSLLVPKALELRGRVKDQRLEALHEHSNSLRTLRWIFQQLLNSHVDQIKTSGKTDLLNASEFFASQVYSRTKTSFASSATLRRGIRY